MDINSSRRRFTFTLFIIVYCSVLPISNSQDQAPPPAVNPCNGIFLTYVYTGGVKIRPFIADKTKQAYRFESTITVLNNGDEVLKSWSVFVGFRHKELLVSASNVVLFDGSVFPAEVGNGTVFSGYPSTDLQTAILTAGDTSQMLAQIDLIGTEFGVDPKSFPMPSNISLANDGFLCLKSTMQGKNQMHVCCTKDPKKKTNRTSPVKFLPRKSGDLTIMYDITRTYSSNYWAQVSIENHNPLGRLDNWELSWSWMNNEFIYAMKGAYPTMVDSSRCIFGPQGSYYQDMDFTTVLSCDRRPVLSDLPREKANDSTLGLVPSCCQGGRILPRWMDPSRAKAAFQMNVFKMPPDLNRSQISVPQSWQINGTMNPTYKCGAPVRVSPSGFPDPSGLLTNKTAVASWQVVCNITRPKGETPSCCVSFSAYNNESIIPCRTCACGCSAADGGCSRNSPALFLPSQALLVPFENRTSMAVAWAGLKHFPLRRPLPCGDNCGVSLNWHKYTDYRDGWSVRITPFNWGETTFPDWFIGLQMDKAAAGFEAAYSFNGTVLDGVPNTIVLQGMMGLNYLVAEAASGTAGEAPVPGKQQSVVSFKKKNTPGINVAGRDGYPTKVFFNGEECLLPSTIPTGSSSRDVSRCGLVSLSSTILVILMFLL